jgi:hypothetical protein
MLDASYSTQAGDKANVLRCNIPDLTQIANLPWVRERPNAAADLKIAAGTSDVSPAMCYWDCRLHSTIVCDGDVVV